ncbi:MAG TPA: TlpA disulfide reductase family protein [Polyangiaceae bacterium]
MSVSSRPAPRSAQRPIWLNAALVLFAAALFGLFALPRLAPEQQVAPDPFVGAQAQDFVLPRIGPAPAGASSKIRLSELEGKAVILDFWATWCMPCREQAPIIERVVKAFSGRGLVAVGVVTDDTAENVLAFAKRYGISYPSVLDDQYAVSRMYAVVGLPTLVVLDRKGSIVAVHRGKLSEKDLRGMAETALR